MIVFDHVTYSYRENAPSPAVDDFSMIIRRGERLVVMGGNGSGKSTFGLLLCGLLRPQAGSIHITSSTGETGPIGILFQDPDNGLVATTVEREVAFTLENRNVAASQMRPIVDRLLTRFSLDPYRERPVWNLSGGEKQRLCLAALFAAIPCILFLDEPSSYLDFEGARMLEDQLDEIQGINTEVTIVRATQFPLIAEKYPRLIIMHKGKVEADGPPPAIFSNYEKLAGFGLRPPMKYFPVRGRPAIIQPKGEDQKPDGPALVLEQVSFSYDDDSGQPVLKGISLTFDRGEVLAIAGKTGSGKSTLAQLICGLYDPAGGRMVFGNGVSRAAMSFQQPERQFFEDTVYDEVSFGIKKVISSNTLIEEKVRQSLYLSGLDFERYRSRHPQTLSGGEARRLGFAIQVALDPDILIFDEPTCGLDESGTRLFIALAQNLKKAGKTVIIISHNGEIIADIADRLVILDAGQITYNGRVKDFFDSADHKGVLAIPEAIAYQKDKYGKVYSPCSGSVWVLPEFSA